MDKGIVVYLQRILKWYTFELFFVYFIVIIYIEILNSRHMTIGEYFKFVIEVGKRIMRIPTIEDFQSNGIKERICLGTDYSQIWSTFSNEDLIYFFRGIVIIEEFWLNRGERIDSTTDTKFIYRDIVDRGLDAYHTLGDWAFQYSSNPYVPLDNSNHHGAITIYDYLRWEDNSRRRNAIQATIQDAAHRKALERKRLNAEAHAKRKEIRDKERGFKK